MTPAERVETQSRIIEQEAWSHHLVGNDSVAQYAYGVARRLHDLAERLEREAAQPVPEVV